MKLRYALCLVSALLVPSISGKVFASSLKDDLIEMIRDGEIPGVGESQNLILTEEQLEKLGKISGEDIEILNTMTEAIVERYGTDRAYLMVGRSPTPYGILMQHMGVRKVVSVPLSSFRYGNCGYSKGGLAALYRQSSGDNINENQLELYTEIYGGVPDSESKFVLENLSPALQRKLFTHFDTYLGELTPAEIRNLVILDYSITGNSLAATKKYLEIYIQEKFGFSANLTAVSFCSSAEHTEAELKEVFKGYKYHWQPENSLIFSTFQFQEPNQDAEVWSQHFDLIPLTKKLQDLASSEDFDCFAPYGSWKLEKHPIELKRQESDGYQFLKILFDVYILEKRANTFLESRDENRPFTSLNEEALVRRAFKAIKDFNREQQDLGDLIEQRNELMKTYRHKLVNKIGSKKKRNRLSKLIVPFENKTAKLRKMYLNRQNVPENEVENEVENVLENIVENALENALENITLSPGHKRNL